MISMNTRLNIKKLDGNIVQKHGVSKQVGLKQLGSKQVGFKQLGPGVETGFHGVQDEKRVLFEVELQGAQRDRKAEVFQVSNDDTAVAQRRLEDKQLEEKTNMDCLVKEREKVHIGIKVGENITVTEVPGQEGAEGRRHIDLESHQRDLQLEVRRERYSRSKLLFQNLQILFKVDFDQGFEGLRLSNFARVLGLIKVGIAKV
ncbi:hypothetical protein Tco_0366061 [Tanacetum coccineum]